MAAVRRPLFWIPMFLGVLIGVVATYLTRPSQTDAQTSRPSLASLQQQIDTLNASVGALNTSLGPLNASVAAVEDDILDIVTGTVAVGAVDGRVKVGTFDGPAEASSAGRLRWGPATQQLEQSDGTQWAPIALDRAPIMWSGGSTTHGTATGWNTYLLDGSDFNTAAGYLNVAPSGTITVVTAGYYKINFCSIAVGTQHADVKVLKNGFTIYYGHEYVGSTANWSDLHADITWRFAAGDTIQVQVLNPGNYAYHQWSSSGNYGRLQVSYVGPSN